MAAYLIQLRARSGWTSIVRELTDPEAALLRTVAEQLTANSGFDGAEMSVRPIAECDEDELSEATWIEVEAVDRLVEGLALPGRCSCSPDGTERHVPGCPDNDEGPAVSATEPSTQHPEGN